MTSEILIMNNNAIVMAADSAVTVGGEIDVAIISKGDGFIWKKRKHYFKSELNPHFFDKD